MRLFLLIAILQFVSISTIYGQDDAFVFNEVGFPSVFSNVKSGEYAATANDVLLIKKPDGKKIILNFQGSQANLSLEEVEEEIYDVSWKLYTGYTSYSDSNNLLIDYQGKTYGIHAIDGACEVVINGLSYTYMAEKETEYLVLLVKRELKLKSDEGDD